VVAALVRACVLWLAGWVVGPRGGGPHAAPAPARPVSGATYVVQPGDTLWSVAARLDRGGDLRDTVQALAKANGGSAITAGQRLVVP
jgi:Tfp pilus assembly protein FimV